jgi:SAM-dependent methyltransferase
MQQYFTNFLKCWIPVFIDYKTIFGLVHLPRYIWQYFKYKQLSDSENIKLYDSYPRLTDAVAYTPFDAHYFYQSAWLARCLEKERPNLHVDIGSSINMLSVLSANQMIVFLDYRPLQTSLGELYSIAGTVTALPFADSSIRSLSSLHVLEHIGLGRYGDPLDPQGTIRACKEIQRVLMPNGKLYISVPVGRERICFNAHRIFKPESIVKLFDGCRLIDFSLVDDKNNFTQDRDISIAENLDYGCGMFVFRKE